MVFDTIHRPLFAESKQVHFPNNNPVSANANGAFCKVRNRCKRNLQSWTKLMKNLDPAPPIWKTEKWHVFALRAASSLIWGGVRRGGWGQMGVCCSIQFCPRLYLSDYLSLCREMKADIQQVRIVSLFRFVVVVFLLAASDCETP